MARSKKADAHSEGVGELACSQLGLESGGFVEGGSWGVREQEGLEARERRPEVMKERQYLPKGD